MNYQTRKQLPKIIASSAGMMVSVGVLGALTWQSIGKVSPDELGCFQDVHQPKTAVIVDASEPRWSSEQGRSINTFIGNLYGSLRFNEKLSVFTTEEDNIASILTPRFHVCGMASNSRELEDINAEAAQASFLAERKKDLFEEALKPELDALLVQSPEESRRQRYESPVLEAIRSVSRTENFQPGDRLVVVGDMIQNSPETWQFCRIQNHLPKFEVSKSQRIYAERIKPQSLEGVEVTVLMLIRPGYGVVPGLEYCASEEELRGWWRSYWTDNGVRDPQFIRLRPGYAG